MYIVYTLVYLLMWLFTNKIAKPCAGLPFINNKMCDNLPRPPIQAYLRYVLMKLLIVNPYFCRPQLQSPRSCRSGACCFPGTIGTILGTNDIEDKG